MTVDHLSGAEEDDEDVNYDIAELDNDYTESVSAKSAEIRAGQNTGNRIKEYGETSSEGPLKEHSHSATRLSRLSPEKRDQMESIKESLKEKAGAVAAKLYSEYQAIEGPNN